ncbi:MAG: Co2+/Mg2+ efflux protein ApaG [Rickettsiales bacterium]
MYSKITNDIKVTVEPFYLEEQSSPTDQRYVWAYTIAIENTGNEKVRLLNRYWHITDAIGMTQEVRGAGVVGEKPLLSPYDVFQYTSGASLRTPSGIMKGEYEFENERKERFNVVIPVFSLDSPDQMRRPN